MTNTDNVGGLPPLLHFAVFDEFGKGADDRVWDYGRRCFEAGKLCRAAPAGGDVPDARDEQEYDDEQCFPEHEVEAMKLEDAQDGAPAGSGEVSRLELAKMELAVTAALFNYEQGDTVSEWLKNTAALLRKLQQESR